MMNARKATRLVLILFVAQLLHAPVHTEEVELTTEHYEARLQLLRRELKSSPNDFQKLVTLASTLHELDHSFPDGGRRVPEAEDAYRRAIRVAPTPEFAAMLEGNLVALLMSAGRLVEALDKMEESIETSSASGRSKNNVGALFNRGKALGMLGKEAEAQVAYREAMQASRGVSPATWAKACASLKDVTNEELQQMESAAFFLSYGTGIAAAMPSRQHASKQMAASLMHEEWGWLEKTDPADSCWLFFALYAALDARKDFDRAWEYLLEANKQQKSEGKDGRRHDDQRLLSMLTGMFPRTTAPGSGAYEALLAGAAGSPDETSIFVVGMPRSGSTLIEQILSSHPQAYGAGEDTALAPLLPSLFKVLGGDGGQISLRAIAAVGDAYIREMRGRAGEKRGVTRIVDKMLRNAWNLGHIAIILPKAKIIWAVRHPMDVALSCFSQPFEGRGTPWASDLEDIAHQIQMTHRIMEHWEAVLPTQILRMPYEDLVTQQEAATRKLLSHVGLPWHPAVLKFHEASRTVQTASLTQVRKKLYKTSVGRWKRYSKHLQTVRERLEPLIAAYEKSVRSARHASRESDEL